MNGNGSDSTLSIAPEHWAKLERIMRMQTENARYLGVARWEYLKTVAKLGDDPDRFKLGQAQFEYSQHERFLMATIERTEVEQKSAGEAALRAAGLDPDKGEYTIAQGGAVLELLVGMWRPVMRPESSVQGKAPSDAHTHGHTH